MSNADRIRLSGIESDFELLRATLYHSSPDARVLTMEEFRRAFLLCDGYGRLTWREIADLGLEWDWSHVRDSSPEAIAAAAASVRESLDVTR